MTAAAPHNAPEDAPADAAQGVARDATRAAAQAAKQGATQGAASVVAAPDAAAGFAPSAPTAATAPTAPDATTRRSRNIAAAALLALIALGLAWELWLAPTGGRTWAIKVLPLALGTVGVLKYRLRTYRWLSMLVWLYVAEGIVRATTERMPGALLAALQCALGLLLFAACATHVRWRLKRGAQLRAAAAARSDAAHSDAA